MVKKRTLIMIFILPKRRKLPYEEFREKSNQLYCSRYFNEVYSEIVRHAYAMKFNTILKDA